MIISFIMHNSPRLPGGGPKVIYEYANYLTARGHNVIIYFFADNLYARFRLPYVIKRLLARVAIALRPNWFKLNKGIKKKAIFSYTKKNIGKADVVIATEVRTAKPVASLPEDRGEKYYFIQDYEKWMLPEEEVQSTYRLGMNNIAVSNWLARLVRDCSGHRCECVSNSINTELFRIIDPVNTRSRHSIAFQYRSNPSKGGKDAIFVIKKLRERYPDLEVIVASIENKPEEMPSFVNYIKGASQEEIVRINNSCSVFMSSSVMEGYGLPGLEAMACGCALASTKYLGVLEYAVDGVNALLSPTNDPQALYENICRLFENDSLRIAIANKGLETAQNKALNLACSKFEALLQTEWKAATLS